MELFWCITLFVLGLIIIIFSGNWMVDNAVKISRITGIPEVLIGATIIALATTLPELNVTIFSSLDGVNELAVGNAMGSIIFNLTFIVGIVMLFTKNPITKADLGSNFYIMFFSIFFVYILGITNFINRFTGIILLTIFLLFFINNIIDANRKETVIEAYRLHVPKEKIGSLWKCIIFFCISSFFVSMGARLLVQNGENLARLMDISEHIIGVSIIAVGTSLPEVVTATASIKHGNTGIAVGNTIGANIMSSTLLLGVSAVMEPKGLVMHSNITTFAIPMILLSSLILFLPILLNRKIYKTQGILLLIMFFAYYLVAVRF